MQDDLLRKIPLTRSPFIFNPKPVTLPYSYVRTPTSNTVPVLPRQEATRDISSDIAQLGTEIDAAEERVRLWQEELRSKKLREARKLAPGFLDTGITMLTPTTVSRAEEQKEVDDTFNDTKDYSSQFAGLKF